MATCHIKLGMFLPALFRLTKIKGYMNSHITDADFNTNPKDPIVEATK